MPAERAADSLVRGIERRSATVAVPGWVPYALRLRSLLTTLDGRIARDPRVAAALRQAEAHRPSAAHISSQADRLRGQIAFASSHGSDAPPLLLTAAKRLEPLDAALARETYLDAFSAAMFAGRLAGGVGVLEVARAARAAPPGPQAPRAVDLLLEGLAVLITEGYEAGTPLLERARSAFGGVETSSDEEIRWGWLASNTAAQLWDDEDWHVLATRHVQLARDAGALSVLLHALSFRIGLHHYAGELAVAASLVEEVAAVTEATGSRLAPYGAVALAAWRGRETEASRLIDATMNEVVARGEGRGLTFIEWASAVLYNGLGRYEDALAAAAPAADHPHELSFSTRALPELIEAATRSGKIETAADALQRLSETTRASATDWALGIEARSRALLSENETAEELYTEAIDRLGRTRVRVEHARAHLVYGEWLRRENRRLDAREQLRRAHGLFDRMGAAAFAERARRELVATGETLGKRTVDTRDTLTAQEAQIARLAREGLSNAEIGSRLFISPRTVEYHLSKTFIKLEIGSRHQLRRALRVRQFGRAFYRFRHPPRTRGLSRGMQGRAARRHGVADADSMQKTPRNTPMNAETSTRVGVLERAGLQVIR